MSENVLGQNLRRHRRRVGFTQAALADRAGISRVAYRNLETGVSEPRTTTLQKLAEALHVNIGELVVPVPELTHVRFRSTRKLKSRDHVLARVSRWLDAYRSLEHKLDDHVEYLLDDFTVPRATKRKSRARRAAEELRELVSLADEPIRDICGLVESLGIKLLQIELSQELDDAASFFGLSVGSEDSGGPAIVVNTWRRIPVERWIFTAAHELAHLILHLQSYTTGETEEDPDEEVDANEFAGHFLVPSATLEKEWPKTAGRRFIQRVLKVKRIFRVSYKTVLYRLQQEYDDTSVWARFHSEYRRAFRRSLGKTEEPEAAPPSEFSSTFPESSRAREPEELSPVDFQPVRLERLVRRAIEDEQISSDRGGEILGITREEMEALQESWM